MGLSQVAKSPSRKQGGLHVRSLLIWRMIQGKTNSFGPWLYNIRAMFSRQPTHTTIPWASQIINIMQRHSDGLRTPSNWSKRTLQLEKKPGPKEFVLPWIILQINKDVKTPLPPWGTFCNLRQPHMSLPSFLSHTLRMLGVYFRLSQGHRLSLGWMFRSKQPTAVALAKGEGLVTCGEPSPYKGCDLRIRRRPARANNPSPPPFFLFASREHTEVKPLWAIGAVIQDSMFGLFKVSFKQVE